MALDGIGEIWTSTDPTARVPAWTGTTITSSTSYRIPVVVSCAPDGVCVEGDQVGDLAATNNAASGVWTQALPIVAGGQLPIPPGDAIAGASCQNGLCVAVTRNGKVLSSTNPAGGASAWKITQIPHAFFNAISCPTSKLCVAFGGSGATPGVLTSTDPTAGASSWHFTKLRYGSGVFGVSCASTRFCLAVADSGTHLLRSTNPTGGPRAWKVNTLNPGTDGGGGVSCPTPSLCVAVGHFVLTSIDPRAGPKAWTSTHVDHVFIFPSVSCPTSTLCVAGDELGNIWTSTDPAAPAQHAARPSVSRGSLTGVAAHQPQLKLTATAGIPPAHEIRQITITAPLGIDFASGQGIITRDSRSRPLKFSSRGHKRTLAINLTQAAQRVQVSASKPALSVSEPLIRMLRTKKVQSLVFSLKLTDAAREATILRLTVTVS